VKKSRKSAFFSLCSIENVISKYQNGVFVDVKHDSSDVKKAKSMEERKRSERGREKEENSGGRKSGEQSLVRMRTRAPSNRNVVFLLSQVSHLRQQRRKNSEKR